MPYRRHVAAAFVLGLTSCAHTPPTPSPLLGIWEATSQNAAGSSFQFRPDNGATWNLGQPFEIQYRVDDSSTPRQLDLFGFTSGSLKGRTLFCLIEISDGTLRMDCEPTDRPTALNPEQTQTFSRTSGGP
jgi:hypothetical protein